MSFSWVLATSPLPPFGGGGGGGEGASSLASVGAGDSAASTLLGEKVARSSLSQESLVLADPDLVAFSSPPGGDRRSLSGGRGDYLRLLLLTVNTLISPSWSSFA